MAMVTARGLVVSPRGTTQHALLPWRTLAVCTTCAAVAILPLLEPSGPGNIAPVNCVMAVSMAATCCWALADRLLIRVPYMLPVGVMALGGLIASFFSVYPGSGLVAVVQDLFFLAWSTTVVTICRTPAGCQRYCERGPTRAWCGRS